MLKAEAEAEAEALVNFKDLVRLQCAFIHEALTINYLLLCDNFSFKRKAHVEV